MTTEAPGNVRVVPGQRTELTRTEAAVRAFHQSWEVMTAACPGGDHAVVDGLVRARTRLPMAPFNGVWQRERHVSAHAVMEAVDEFAAGDLPWNIELRPGYPAELDATLAGRGLVVTAEIPFMVLTEADRLEAALARSGAALRRMETFADLDSNLTLLEEGYGMPPELTRERFPMQMLFVPGSSTWLASVDGTDVSTGLGITVDAMTGVFNVATPEAHRGRGFGAAVSAQSVLAGFAAGAQSAYLQSSPMGYPVYEKLGFVTVEHWRQWMPAEYAD